MDSVAEDPVLEVYERGDRAYIGIDQSQRLDHEWAGNVVDLCPVGSLLSKDFLHKARAWDLDKAASICPGCTQGCNMTVDTRDEVVVRLRPRPNLEVNRHFLCDTGRADYRWMNRGDRVEAPLVARQGPPPRHRLGRRSRATWPILSPRDGSVVVLAGGRASCESIGWVMSMVAERSVTAAMQVPRGEKCRWPPSPIWHCGAERAANLDGASLFGYGAEWTSAIDAVRTAALVIVLDVELTDDDAEVVAGARQVVDLGSVAHPRLSGAQLVLPVTTMVEEQGVFVNRDRRAQRFLAAKSAPGMARPAWWVAAQAWARAGEGRSAPATASEAFGSLAPFEGISYRDLGLTGRVLTGVTAEAT